MQAGRGEGYFSNKDSDATRSSSWSNTDKDDDKDDAEDSDIDISDDDFDKGDNDADGFGRLEALLTINVPEPVEEYVQAKVLTEMKKQLPTHVPKAIANFIKPRLNIFQLHNILIDSMSLDQEHLNAQYTKPTLKIMPHDDWDPPNDHEGEKRSKRRKDARESSSKSSKKDKALMDSNHLEWFSDAAKKFGLVDAANRKPERFDMLFNSNIDQDKTVMVAKKIKELIKKDKLTIADLEGARLEILKNCYKNDVELEYYVDQIKSAMLEEAQWSDGDNDLTKPRSFEKQKSKSAKPDNRFYNRDLYYLAYLSTEEKYTSSLTKHYAARYYIKGKM
ncbi:hypothetical protein Tco_0957013 [Tanacetum coccineum]